MTKSHTVCRSRNGHTLPASRSRWKCPWSSVIVGRAYLSTSSRSPCVCVNGIEGGGFISSPHFHFGKRTRTSNTNYFLLTDKALIYCEGESVQYFRIY